MMKRQCHLQILLSCPPIVRAPSLHVYFFWKIDPNVVITEMETAYPILLLPKKYTSLETNYKITDNVLIHVNVTSPDTEGNNTCIYSGFCNIKLIDSYDVSIQFTKTPEPSEPDSDDTLSVVLADQQSQYNQSEVWIDPARSPYVYKEAISESQESYSVCHQTGTSITVQQQHNTYITKYKYREAIHYSTHEEVEKMPKLQAPERQNLDGNMYEDDEFECAVFLTELHDKIINENQKQAIQERKFIDIQSDNSALKQLMSPGIQSSSKQQKTMVPDSQSGQTIQRIGYYDPMIECSGIPRVDNEVIIEDTNSPRQKRYECASCQQIFDQIADFREHMGKHSYKYSKCAANRTKSKSETGIQFICNECGKTLKSREKFERHCQAHLDPDLECSICHKVFVSKFTLRTHRKIHNRKYCCPYCTKTYSKFEELRAHNAKIHHILMCDLCEFVCFKRSELTAHKEIHEIIYKESSVTELADSRIHEVEKMPKLQAPERQNLDGNMYEDDEFRFIDIQSDNSALKQLMSPGIQSSYKQQKTMVPDSQSGQTIQRIGYYDPMIECSGIPRVDNEVIIEDTNSPRQKRYECASCQQIFDQIADFREHMGKHSYKYSKCAANRTKSKSETGIQFICNACGKTLKSREKFERHCQAHLDPDLECSICHKVFVSKFTLRTHRKIHNRKYCCPYCTKTYSKFEELRAHNEKIHHILMCDLCEFVCFKRSELTAHKEIHEIIYKESSVTELADSLFNDLMSDDDIIDADPDWKIECEPVDNRKSSQRSFEIEIADSVIAKVMSNKMFLADKTKRSRRYRKICGVCKKSFDRVSDLKRHLIEHVVRSTLAKTPVTRAGTLTIHCEVCQKETFTRVDRYKAHLREHAKLTIYKCTFCNKSFSDSSNLSKHKKIHGTTYFQCDLCNRKFNTKNMITRHMEYHNKNKPLPCSYCTREFHFKSMLNKHVKRAHTKESPCRFRCRFCDDYFKSLREKWDHEWKIHNVRKMIVDCLICGTKFRKYAKLKRHYSDKHGVEIPTAKTLLNC